GRPHRRAAPRPARARRGQGRADAQARQEAARAAAARAARRRRPVARRMGTGALGRRLRTRLRLRRRRPGPQHRRAARRARCRRHRAARPAHRAELARGHLRAAGAGRIVNRYAIGAIYRFEMARMRRTLLQSVVSPVVSTSLYFVVFGSAIGSRIEEIDGVSYGSFIVPGLMMLTLLQNSISNASFGIYFPKFVGTIYEVLSAPISFFEIVLGYVGAAASKSLILGAIILATAHLFVDVEIRHPFWMLFFLVATAVTFSLFGFIIGIWADGFEKLQLIPLLIITPLVFLGGSFYSIEMLP